MIENDETIKVEIEIGNWDMQRPKGLLHVIRELELDKLND